MKIVVNNRDIVLEQRSDKLIRIYETHRSYDALQYPLMFVNGEDGYHFYLRQMDPKSGLPSSKKLSAQDFYSFRLMVHKGHNNHLLRCRQLLSQYVVDMYAKIESERLRYLRMNQRQLRVESYIHLRDALVNDNLNEVGQVTILPSTFTGGPRYMHEKTQDAMCYVRNFGRPDLFVTFTCNPNWEEIKQELFPGQAAPDRHDVVARVFKLKLQKMMELLTKKEIFGKTKAFLYSVEWQKRGLPHAHILLWLSERIHLNDMDTLISAEIPSSANDFILHEIVKKHMIHGPCGTFNPNSPCMQEGRCGKNFPKKMVKETQTSDDGYPSYRRRSVDDGGNSLFLRRGMDQVEIDNRWIVPYNPVLSKAFNAHINVEFCNSVKSIKYVCKYVNKGCDMCQFSLDNQTHRDEIKNYEMGRYISSNEAMWRIFSFNIHERFPPVQHLSVHLENGQRVLYNENDQDLAERLQNPPRTTLTEFFDLCTKDEFAETLLYCEVPHYYTWTTNKKFKRRVNGERVEGNPGIKMHPTLGRVYTVHPNNRECFYLRLLLQHVRGPKSFKDLRTVDGEICANYQEACIKLRLLQNDDHWVQTLDEAASVMMPKQMRDLFAVMLSSCELSSPLQLWEKFKTHLSEDFLHQVSYFM